jgi:hypothetical protein
MGSKRSGTGSGQEPFHLRRRQGEDHDIAVVQRHGRVRETKRDGPPPLGGDLAEARAGPDSRPAVPEGGEGRLDEVGPEAVPRDQQPRGSGPDHAPQRPAEAPGRGGF